MENDKITIEVALKQHGYLIRPVVGDSMLPMLDEEQDMVKLVPISEPLKKFDIPLYRRPDGKLVLHRIIKVKKGCYITCGDNRIHKERISADWMIAVMDGFYKNGKYISKENVDYQKYVMNHCRMLRNRKVMHPIKMPSEWTILLQLFRMAITNNIFKIDIGFDFNWDNLYKLAQKQKITASIYPAIVKQQCPDNIITLFQKHFDMNLRRHILFDAERNEILSEFVVHGIRYVLLKGCVLNQYYPTIGMREFADNDILYDVKYAKIVNKIMLEKGYTCKAFGGIHDSYLKEPIFNFEMHRTLFGADMQQHFDDIWSRVIPNSEYTNRYDLTFEDLYLHVIAHLNKHYNNSGAGLRYFSDIWLMNQHMDTKDKPYIQQRLKQANLVDFEKKVVQLSTYIFEEKFENIPKE